ncbi:COMPASS (Complex proteins associated with set1p) component shg1 domain-containing protein [Phthorimaea operculella]|nr:COMPASS (Complex proteins associated with set1p) component shg1 domain-containing protein [Phthorimaea operculella]
MAHLQYMPGDPRLVDQLVYELKSKGIFDQFRKECIADVDTRPAYQNLRQRVETSVATFLSRQVWKPDLNKNQLREKLRKHLLDGNYLEQGVERIVDQVVNPKVASVFIPQVEDLVYNYLGIPRKKSSAGPETSNGKPEDLLPTDLEAVSPGSVKSTDDKDMDTSDSKDDKMDVDDKTNNIKDDSMTFESFDKEKEDTRLSGISELTIHDSDSASIDKSTITIPLPAEIKLENIPAPENSPPNIKDKNIDLEKIDLPKEPNLSTDIPLPDEIPKVETDSYFKPIALQSEDDEDSSDSSIKRNMSPLTPIRNFNNENSYDAQQAFENDSDSKTDDKKEPSSFRFTIESKSSENSSDAIKIEKKEEPVNYQFSTPVINSFNTPIYDDSSNSNNLQIDYESDANSKITDAKPEPDQNSKDSHKTEKKDDKRSSHKSSHRSRDSSRHSSSKDKRADSKHSSRDSSRHDKKSSSSKDDKSKSTEKKSEKEKSGEKSDRGDKKDSRESSKHRSSSHKDSKDSKSSSSHKDSKHKSSSTSSSKHSSKDDKKTSSSSRDKEKERSSSKSKDSRDKSKDCKDKSKEYKDRKSSSSSKRSDDKENKEKKEKKEADDHYSLSGRGNPNRRSTDRDSNDGSSSSKGSHNPTSKTAESKKDSKPSSKSGSTSSSDSTSPSDGVEIITAKTVSQTKPIVRVDTRLENPMSSPPRLPFVPDITMKKPKFAANMQEAKELIKMRKFLEEEQKRMNQEAALLLEFQANVRPSLSQVFSSIPGPELEFACMPNGQPNTLEENDLTNDVAAKSAIIDTQVKPDIIEMTVEEKNDDEIAKTLTAMHDDDHEEVFNDTKEIVEAKVEHTDASVLEDLTDQESELIIVEEVPELLEDEIIVIKNDEDGEIDRNVKVDDEGMKTEAEVSDQSIELIQIEDLQSPTKTEMPSFVHSEEIPLHYFCENEKFDAELESNRFNIFFKKFTEQLSSKLFLVNCDTYEENIIREVAQNFGEIDVVNYFKNGHLKLPKNIVKNVNVSTEINLPTKVLERPITPNISAKTSPIFSPRSECSFELTSDYDAKLEEMVNKTSRQEIMEIILGGTIGESPSKMPRIDYCMDSNIEENTVIDYSMEENAEENVNTLKRKCDIEVECNVNNNIDVLTPNKLRKMSGSDQISSTTEETEETPNNNRVQTTQRSKFLGKARRVGLPKPKKSNIQNSPSSDKSVENYEQNATPNGKIKPTPRSKVQRYDTSDLYKPKLHYLSRRNNIS